MTIKQRGRSKICSSAFQMDGQDFFFAFNGKKGMPLITNKSEAKVYEAKLKTELQAGTFIADSPLQNFARFYEEVFMDYSRQHKVKKAQMFDSYYGEMLIAEFGKLKLYQVKPRMIERFLVRLSQTKTRYGRLFSPVTVRMVYNRLNQMFNLAIREREAKENPCDLVSPAVLENFPVWQPRGRYLNKYAEDEEERLFKELDGKLQVICRLLLNTGLRPPQEILKVEKAHVNLLDKPKHYRLTERDGTHLSGKHVIIPPRAILVVHGKDNTTRLVPLNETAHGMLAVLCDDIATGDFLFTNRLGEVQESIKKGFRAACERAGIEDLRPYDLRGTFATRLVDRGIPSPVISSLMGHVAPNNNESRITHGYAQATWEMKVWAVESLEQPPVFDVSRWDSGKSRANRQENEGFQREAKVG